MNRPTKAAPEGFMHAWYSAKADNASGTAIYKRENGDHVAVTEVCEGHIPFTKWDDLEYVGVVFHHNNGGCVGVSRRAACWR